MSTTTVPSTAMNKPSSNRTSGSNTMDEATVDLATAHVHESIRLLLADEIPSLAEVKGQRIFTDPYLHLSFESFTSYLHFVMTTWMGVAHSFWHTLKGQIKIFDFVTLVFFSVMINTVLTMGVIMCLVMKFPFVESVFGLYSRVNGGFSLINSLNTHMFSSLTKKEIRLCKAALSSTEPVNGKEFNLDVAKLLLLFSSVVYERTSLNTREAIKHSHSIPKIPRRRSRNNSPSGATSPINGSFPMGAVPASPSPLTPPPSRPSHSGSSHRHHHGHHRSLSHLSSQFTSQMQSSLQRFQSQVQTHESHLLKLFGTSAQQIRSILHSGEGDNVIQELVGRLDVEYEPVSELNSASSSYASMFWDRRQNWVVVAFKGTSPAEFDEWLTDFDVTRIEAGHHLPGYKQIHRGFKNRLFPESNTIHLSPYQTIIAALKVISNDLASRTDKDINVWFTGHSLGCAMATLTYTRALLGLDGLSPRVHLCDAYLYGAPVVCDIASAKLFNQYMEHRKSSTGKTRTVWRVTNHCDAVCTLLPMLGDDPLYPNVTSLFAYAHIGSEVKMRVGPGKSIIVDNYCQSNTPARVVAGGVEEVFESDDETEVDPVGYAMNPQEYKMMKEGNRKGLGVPWWIAALEYIPLGGRMVSHFPGLYFRSLQQMAPGDFIWRRA